MSSGQSDSVLDSPQTSSTQTVTLVFSVFAPLVLSGFCKVVIVLQPSWVAIKLSCPHQGCINLFLSIRRCLQEALIIWSEPLDIRAPLYTFRLFPRHFIVDCRSGKRSIIIPWRGIISFSTRDAFIAYILRISDCRRSSEMEEFGGIFLPLNNEKHVLHIAYQIIYNP